MPELDEAALAFADSLRLLNATATEVYAYYGAEDYKNDGFAKGKALHKPLLEQLEAFVAASKRFLDTFDNANDALRQASLQRMEKEGRRNLAYVHRTNAAEHQALAFAQLADFVSFLFWFSLKKKSHVFEVDII